MRFISSQLKEGFIKEAIDEVKNEVKAKLLLWKNIKNTKVKVILIFLFLGLVGLKVFTTVLTFDWLARLLS
ncbi:hypothetical protein N9Q14_03820 [Pseudomonadales bacterium]|nr:hypothetical protein [Pseudomonadales bacterium]